MSERRTGILLVLLAALALWVFAVEGVGGKDGSSETSPALVDCSKASITSLEVRRGDAAVRGRRSDGRWSAEVEPSRRQRTATLLADLADGLCRMPALDHAPLAERGADFGLDPAVHRIFVERGEQSRTLVLGRTTPAGNLLYARFADEPTVLTIGAWFGTAAERVLAAGLD